MKKMVSTVSETTILARQNPNVIGPILLV